MTPRDKLVRARRLADELAGELQGLRGVGGWVLLALDRVESARQLLEQARADAVDREWNEWKGA